MDFSAVHFHPANRRGLAFAAGMEKAIFSSRSSHYLRFLQD
jgi:hypothetical protein